MFIVWLTLLLFTEDTGIFLNSSCFISVQFSGFHTGGATLRFTEAAGSDLSIASAGLGTAPLASGGRADDE
ncbi:hypothetical protein WMW72_02635 [Paenibacillus filicis]|uniref:Secreted protein n=1 Tax=Paenibacillus filicis TaxID=669464 RepID=A0ABU9DEU5_9BACL